MVEQSRVVSPSGSFLLIPWRNDSIQFKRNSLKSTGLPEINGNDVFRMNLVVSKDASAEKKVERLLAMDVNGDGLINAGDITEVLRRIVYPQTGFAQANLNADTAAWRFFPKAYLTERSNFSLSSKYPEDDQIGLSRLRVPKIDSLFHPHLRLNCNMTVMPIAAIFLGDADGSLGLNGADTKGKLKTWVTIDAKNSTRQQDTFRIPIYANEWMQGFDCVFDNYADATKMIAVTSASPKIVLMSNLDAPNKKCLITGFATEASGIAPNQPICYITVKAACIDESVLGTITSYWNGNLASATVRSTCSVPTQETAPTAVKVFPNPTTNGLTITYEQLPDKIQLFNIMGSLVKNIEPFHSQTIVDMSQLLQGVYLLKIGNKIFKIIKQ
jgi:hypothetical protein